MRIIAALLLIIGLSGAFFYYLPAINTFTYSLEKIDTSNLEQIREVPSQNGDKLLTIYYRGGPFLVADFSFIGEVEFSEPNQESRVLFWHSNNRGQVVWEDNETISLQLGEDVIYLNVSEDTYDFREKIR